VSVSRSAEPRPPFDGPYDNHQQTPASAFNQASPPDAPPDYGDIPVDDGYDEYAPAPAYYEYPGVESEVNPTKKPDAAQPPASPPAELPAASALASVPEPRLRQPVDKVSYTAAGPDTWTQIYLGLGVTGILQSTASNLQLVGRRQHEFQFVLDENNSTLYDASHQQRLAELLSEYFGTSVQVAISLGKITAETPAATAIRLRAERQQDAVRAIHSDPIVQKLIAHFDAVIREDSIQPVI